MNKEELQMLGFEIVAYSGTLAVHYWKLLKEVRQGNFEHVDSALKEADENNPCTQFVNENFSGRSIGKRDGDGIHFIHGQDHLMTTLLLRDLIQDFALYKQNQG